MKIPNGEFATVDLAKLRDYCLNPSHPEGKHKARVFAAMLGLSLADLEFLHDELLKAAQVGDARIGEKDKYGDRYVVDLTMTNGARRARVRSAWIIPPGKRIPHLTSCYVLLKRGQND